MPHAGVWFPTRSTLSFPGTFLVFSYSYSFSFPEAARSGKEKEKEEEKEGKVTGKERKG